MDLTIARSRSARLQACRRAFFQPNPDRQGGDAFLN